MKTLLNALVAVSLLGLVSCSCNCNKYNPDLLKDYKPTTTKQFQ
ncbi:MAG: hypothetical protein RR250_05915 [Akkermansia sp.]